MSSLIGNKIKINFVFSLISVLYCKHYLLQRSSNYDCSIHMQLDFTQGWLNSYCLTSALSYPFIVLQDSLTNVLDVECSCSRFLENSKSTTLLFVRSLTCLSLLSYTVVVGLHVHKLTAFSCIVVGVAFI